MPDKKNDTVRTKKNLTKDTVKILESWHPYSEIDSIAFCWKYRGEFGTDLTLRINGENFTIRVHIGNIVDTFKYRDKIYLISGSCHLAIGRKCIGWLHKLDINITRKEFTFEKILDFDDYLKGVTVFKDRIFITSSYHLYVIKDFEIEEELARTSPMFFKDIYIEFSKPDMQNIPSKCIIKEIENLPLKPVPLI